MQEFIAKHQEKIAGTLSGFDRIVFRGHLRSIGYPEGMMCYLWTNHVYLKNFGDHVEMVTKRQASLAEATACGRPVQYLNSSQIDKETIARNIKSNSESRTSMSLAHSITELTTTPHPIAPDKKLILDLAGQVGGGFQRLLEHSR